VIGSVRRVVHVVLGKSLVLRSESLVLGSKSLVLRNKSLVLRSKSLVELWLRVIVHLLWLEGWLEDYRLRLDNDNVSPGLTCRGGIIHNSSFWSTALDATDDDHHNDDEREDEKEENNGEDSSTIVSVLAIVVGLRCSGCRFLRITTKATETTLVVSAARRQTVRVASLAVAPCSFWVLTIVVHFEIAVTTTCASLEVHTSSKHTTVASGTSGSCVCRVLRISVSSEVSSWTTLG
jgi:hypothetical protein